MLDYEGSFLTSPETGEFILLNYGSTGFFSVFFLDLEGFNVDFTFA